ncbi:MAG: hypothetical protein [Microvirus sp.]|nr:MAG: hypothetical protein [Microvirus sp.]
MSRYFTGTLRGAQTRLNYRRRGKARRAFSRFKKRHYGR